MAVYKGFSTSNWLKTKSFSIADIDVIKEDLANHIFTRLGERVVMPGFGTRIPDLPFEPNDADTVSIIEEDVLKVLSYDPRIEVVGLNVYPIPDNNTIIVEAVVYYIEFQFQDVLQIDVKNKSFI